MAAKNRHLPTYFMAKKTSFLSQSCLLKFALLKSHHYQCRLVPQGIGNRQNEFPEEFLIEPMNWGYRPRAASELITMNDRFIRKSSQSVQ